MADTKQQQQTSEICESLKRKGVCSVGKQRDELFLLVKRVDGVGEDLEKDDRREWKGLFE